MGVLYRVSTAKNGLRCRSTQGKKAHPSSVMPEPTLFGSPPPGASAPEQLAFYSHYAGMALGTAGALLSFARCGSKGVAAGIAQGLGLAGIAGAAFAGKCLYANFLYQDAARSATETRLFILAAATGLFGAGIGLIPGYKSRLGSWQNIVVPALSAAGCALAGVGLLPSMSSGAATGLTIIGGLIFTGAGVILFLERNGRGENPQARVGMPFAMAILIGGLLTAAGSMLASTTENLAKGTLALSLAEAIFALFAVLGLLSINDYVRPATAARQLRPAAVPPPPPGVAIPPPPAPGAPRAPTPPPPPAGAAPTPAPARAPAPTPARAPAPAKSPAPSQPTRPGIQKPPGRP